MEDNENNEDLEPTVNTDKDDDQEEEKKQLEKLNEYVQQMAYMPTKPPLASQRTEALSKAPKKYLLGTYSLHKDNFKPKERSNRIGRIVQQHTPMTIKDLEEFIWKHRKQQSQMEKDIKQQQINYHETLMKLQKQCENQLMNTIVHKFAKLVSKKAASRVTSSSLEVKSESYQRLENAIFCTMIYTLKVPDQHKQTKDFIVYKKLAGVLADLIFQALFLAHTDEEQYCEDQEVQQEPNSTENDLLIQLRALRAAKKKVNHSRQRNSSGY